MPDPNLAEAIVDTGVHMGFPQKPNPNPHPNLAEAMIDTGVHMGFPRETSEKLVIKTVEGSTAYLKASGQHVAALRNDITSPGGTTAAASAIHS